MGRIIKYNIAKSEGSGRVQTVTSVTTGYPTNNDVKQETSCNFWGNSWHGYEDLMGSMLINGDVNIYWDDEDYDESLYDEEEGDEIPTGSLYVSGKIEGSSVYGKTVFLDYPNRGNKKTDLLDILKDFEARIAKNTSDIGALDVRVTNNFNEIEGLKSRTSILENKVVAIGDRLELTINNVQENSDKINNLSTDIEELYNITDNITDNIIDIKGDIRDIYNKLGNGGGNSGGDVEVPNIYDLEFKEGRFATTTYKPTESVGSVYIPTKTSHLENDNNFLTQNDVDDLDLNTITVLFSGTLVSNNNNGSLTWQEWTVNSSLSAFNKHMSSLAAVYQSTTNNWPALRLQLFSKTGYNFKITSLTGLVTKTHDYDIESQTAGGNLRGKGYWLTGGVIDNGMTGIIQAWRTHDDNNDSVRADALAYRCQQINVTIYGIVTKKN